jgi:hypothetical protein
VEGEAQGVGPHKDSMLSSYLLQASHHRGLQVQNPAGEWVDCPPIDGTLVVAIGQGMEALTQGVCQSTTHRVLSPARGSGPRFSIPFFQGVSYDATFESMDVPASVKELRSEILERRGTKLDDVEFTFIKGQWSRLGEATLMNRIKSHPDVGERWVGLLRFLSADDVLTRPSIQNCSRRYAPSRRKMQRRQLIRQAPMLQEMVMLDKETWHQDCSHRLRRFEPIEQNTSLCNRPPALKAALRWGERPA